MEFAAANIWQDFKTTSRTEQGTLDDSGNEVVLGPRLNEAVRHLANGYLKQLELGPPTKATDERAKLLDLHLGRIEHDAAQLRGLGAAMTNFAEVLGANVTTLAQAWKGESYDAFKAAIDKVRQTLAAYGEAATITGDGLVNAMSQVRELYQIFADDSADKHLNFSGFSPPEEWHKVRDWEDRYSGKELADNCPSSHGNVVDYNLNCLKNDDEQRNLITGRWVTERRWQICKDDGCEENAGRVNTMYRTMVDECQAAVDRIEGKLESYFGAVRTTIDGVSKLYDAALGNVYNLAHEEVFSSLRVIGGQLARDPTDHPTGGTPVDGGDPSAGEPAAVAEPMEPEPSPEPAPVDTVAQEEPPPTAEAQVDDSDSMKIKDGDHTIGVTSPDGEGRFLVTVEDGTGATKTYALDFLAASGLAADQPTGDEAGVVQVPARTNGKCVIEDGPLTITAERPLFAPDSIEFVVDDGSGDPRTYTLDFEPQEPPPPAAGTTAGSPGQAPTSQALAGEVSVGGPAPADTSPPGEVPPVQNAAPDAAHLTSPQSWHGDQSGSVSGVLVPDQPGMAGAVPIVGAPSGGGAESPGRAGSGWSVHGDLFDNAEPVYSMHGVLGDDDTAE